MLGMGLLSWERQRIRQGLLDVQQCEILVWGCCYHGKDLLKESPSFSTPERPVWSDLGSGVLVPVRFMEDTPGCRVDAALQ